MPWLWHSHIHVKLDADTPTVAHRLREDTRPSLRYVYGMMVYQSLVRLYEWYSLQVVHEERGYTTVMIYVCLDDFDTSGTTNERASEAIQLSWHSTGHSPYSPDGVFIVNTVVTRYCRVVRVLSHCDTAYTAATGPDNKHRGLVQKTWTSLSLLSDFGGSFFNSGTSKYETTDSTSYYSWYHSMIVVPAAVGGSLLNKFDENWRPRLGLNQTCDKQARKQGVHDSRKEQLLLLCLIIDHRMYLLPLQRQWDVPKTRSQQY